jgi:hypothetical protein
MAPSQGRPQTFPSRCAALGTFGFAAAGDTNLDWQVDIIDAANFLAGGRFDTGLPATWNQGDFTYDGVVDILDAASFVSNGLFDAGVYNVAGTMVAMPEPGGVMVVGLGLGIGLAWVLAARRYRVACCIEKGAEA